MKITDALLKEIYAHAQETYPRECVGFLVGEFQAGGRVRQIARGTNLNQERNDRFEIDPAEFVRVDRAAEDEDLSIVGLYHSHPNWPAIPSQTDLSSEVEGYYYMIISIVQGQPLNTGLWQIAEDEPRRFVQLPLEIVDSQIVDDQVED